jgi:hypothetical protein
MPGTVSDRETGSVILRRCRYLIASEIWDEVMGTMQFPSNKEVTASDPTRLEPCGWVMSRDILRMCAPVVCTLRYRLACACHRLVRTGLLRALSCKGRAMLILHCLDMVTRQPRRPRLGGIGTCRFPFASPRHVSSRCQGAGGRNSLHARLHAWAS